MDFVPPLWVHPLALMRNFRPPPEKFKSAHMWYEGEPPPLQRFSPHGRPAIICSWCQRFVSRNVPGGGGGGSSWGASRFGLVRPDLSLLVALSDSVERHLSQTPLQCLNVCSILFSMGVHLRKEDCVFTKAASIPARRQTSDRVKMLAQGFFD